MRERARERGMRQEAPRKRSGPGGESRPSGPLSETIIEAADDDGGGG